MEDKATKEKENVIQEQARNEEKNKEINEQPAPEIITSEIAKTPNIDQKNSKNELIENPKPIQLVISKNGILEMTIEAIKIFTTLKKKELSIVSINGPCGLGKSMLANNIIENETGFKTGVKTEGIWLWNYPIPLNNGNRLLILDCQGLDKNDKISHKLFILSTLLSSCMIYYIENEINENTTEQFKYFFGLLKEIKINKEENDDINELKNYFPELIFVNNEFFFKYIQDKKDDLSIIKSFEKMSYLNIKEKNIKEIKLRMEQIKSKKMRNISIDGDSLFCLLQNCIDFINNDKPVMINLAFENVLLSKTKNISEEIFQQFKDEINKEIEYPIECTIMNNNHFILQKQYFKKFCETVDKILNPVKTGEYIGKIFDNMIIELQSIFEKNKEILYEKICVKYKAFQEGMNKINISDISTIKEMGIFVISYTRLFKDLIDDNFSYIIKALFNESSIDIFLKIFEEYFVKKLTFLVETFDKIYQKNSEKCKSNINVLNLKIKELNELLENDKKSLEKYKKENLDLVKTFSENELQLKKDNEEMKIQLSELQDKYKMNEEKMKAMTEMYEKQIKEKDKKIEEIEELKKKMKTESDDKIDKINKLNKENIKLKNEIEDMKGKQVEEKSGENDQQIQSLFKQINTQFTEFRESIDNLEKNSEKILSEKTNYKDEIDNHINNCKTDVKEIKKFCQKQIEEMEKNLISTIGQNKDVSFGTNKKEEDLNDQNKIKEFENKLKQKEEELKEIKETINGLNETIEISKNSLKIKDELINIYQKTIDADKNKINDLELSLSRNIYNYKMAEDDFDTLLIIFQGILQKDKEKYYKNIKKLGSNGRNFVISLVKKYNIFSDI